MKLKNVFSALVILMVVLLSSCDNNQESYPSPTAFIATPESALTASFSPEISASLKKSGSYSENSNIKGGVNLGVAGDFVILSKTGITDVFKSAVTGDIGSSPITGAAILLKCSEVTGAIYTVDAAGPLPCRITNASRLTTAVGDMQTAYTDVAGRSNPNFLNLGAGNIGGKTLKPGLYKWTSAVIIPSNVTISGGPNDIFIFQVSGTLTMASAVKITLTGGAKAKNIFWQTTGAVTFGTSSHFEGTILSKTGINLQTGATINGRMLAQTAVTLQMNTVTRPQ